MVDEAGYLQGDLDELADEAGRAALADRRRCSATLQRFDPPGVFARNLAECLALQLQGAEPLRSADRQAAGQSALCSAATTWRR